MIQVLGNFALDERLLKSKEDFVAFLITNIILEMYLH